MEVGADGVAVITINNPPLNLLSVDDSRDVFVVFTYFGKKCLLLIELTKPLLKIDRLRGSFLCKTAAYSDELAAVGKPPDFNLYLFNHEFINSNTFQRLFIRQDSDVETLYPAAYLADPLHHNKVYDNPPLAMAVSTPTLVILSLVIVGFNHRGRGRQYHVNGPNTILIIILNRDSLGINPTCNHVHVMFSLKENTEEALQRDDVKAIVITGSNGKFSGGFDVTAFGHKVKLEKPGFFSIDIITDTFEAGRKPLVAAINGPALGGGLEIALACHARISTSSAQLGLPELRYGILPGFGGTQRLPRLVGISMALEMMLMSKLVNGYRAQSSGLVDALAATEELVDTACSWALDIYNCKKPWVPSLYRTDKLEPLGEAKLMFNFARLLAQKQTPNLRHPLVCVDVIEEGVVSGPRESEALLELRQSDTCKSLVHFFFAQRGTAKIPGISGLGLVPRKVNKVAVVGG
ncbi:hypothetical protein SADUNF_Sadunf02G0163700 [Salix dunnii]|uniref:Uncharacterized protein n=1 Tax=Salix dunnii TaxID=1413687 RepID=A0A835N8D0_9ROSI|nr:hypothetical protein SADUNF_Sadunf02G0163700 [Salix dunnii]